MSAPAMLHCAGCGRRFGRRARAVLLLESCLVCEPCSHDIAVHRKLFKGCPQRHCLRDRGGDLTTIGVARQTLAPLQKGR
jgi:hypothetical protein